MRYKKDDKVVIVSERTEDMSPYGHMDKYLGTIMTIGEVFSYDYFMKEDDECWNWTDEMIDYNETRKLYYGRITEPVTANTRFITTKPNGGSSGYYELPPNAKQLQDLIEHRNMNGNIKDVFKACYRIGNKDGIDEEYDLRKIVYFGLRELGRVKGTKDYLGLADEIIGDQSEKGEHMSQMEFHVGIAKEVAKGVEGFVPKLKSVGFDISNLEKYEIEEEYIESEDYFWSREYKKLFQFIVHKESWDDDEICEGEVVDDEVHFILQYHNGGNSFGGMFESLLSKLEETTLPTDRK